MLRPLRLPSAAMTLLGTILPKGEGFAVSRAGSGSWSERRICNVRRPPPWLTCLDRHRAPVVGRGGGALAQSTTSPGSDAAVARPMRRRIRPRRRTPTRRARNRPDRQRACNAHPGGLGNTGRNPNPAEPAGGPASGRSGPADCTGCRPTGGSSPAAPSITATPPHRRIPATSRRPLRRHRRPLRAPPAVPTIDTAITDQLHQLASGKFDHLLGGKPERTEIEAFYSGRNYAPLWITDGHANDRAKAAIDYLGHVDADGLDPADYPVPDFKALDRPGNAGRSRTAAHHVGHDLRAPCVDRAHRLVARERRHRVRPEAAGAGQRARRHGRGQGRGRGARRLRAACAGLPGAQGQACGNPRRQRRRRQAADPEWAGAQGRRSGRPGAGHCAIGLAFSATAARPTTRRWPKR